MRFPKNRIDELKESVRKGDTSADQGSRDPTLANREDGAPDFLKFQTETHEEAGPPVQLHFVAGVGERHPQFGYCQTKTTNV